MRIKNLFLLCMLILLNTSIDIAIEGIHYKGPFTLYGLFQTQKKP